MTKNEPTMTIESFTDEQSLDPDGEPPEPTLRVLIADQQSTLAIDEAQLQAAVRAVFDESPYTSGSISIAVVDDPTIHQINRQYLQHDYPTDVLSFALEDQEPYLEGELIVSIDTATRNAAEYGWPAFNELLLYVIHGALHLVGYRDKQPTEIVPMRTAEAKHLRELGIVLPVGAARWTGHEASNDAFHESSDEVLPS